MKMKKMLGIVGFALCLIALPVSVSWAWPTGTGFTCQGQLWDGPKLAKGFYDFEFRLFDDPCTGIQQGGTINIYDLDITDGYFTVDLDFGPDVFTGEARWLEIGVRPSASPGSFTTLAPRREVTPAPYVLYAETAGSLAGGASVAIGGGGTANYIAKFTGPNTVGDSVMYESGGNVGVGTTTPGVNKLRVAGNVDATGFSEGGSNTLSNDISGNAATAGNADTLDGYDYSPDWPTDLSNIQTACSNDFHNIGGADDDAPDGDGEVPDDISIDNGGLYAPSGGTGVGVGTVSPRAVLDVNGGAILLNGGEVNEFSTDGTLADNSDSAVPTEKAVKTYVDSQIPAPGAGVVPVGGVVAWMKSFPNTPTLPSNFVECNGQTLNDANSPYNGQTIPNLNGSGDTKRFLRGSATSGTTGGSESHAHAYCSDNKGYLNVSSGADWIQRARCFTTQGASTLPSYYEVVWVIRVK